MTQPTQLTGSYWAVEVPEGAFTWDIVKVDGKHYLAGDDDHGNMEIGTRPLPPGSWTLIGHVKDIPEDLAATIVERQGEGYKDYSGGFHHDIPCVSAVDSLRGLGNVVVIKKE
jgi:hypothetical protein